MRWIMVDLGCLSYQVIRALKKCLGLSFSRPFGIVSRLGAQVTCPLCAASHSFPMCYDSMVAGGRLALSSSARVWAFNYMSFLLLGGPGALINRYANWLTWL